MLDRIATRDSPWLARLRREQAELEAIRLSGRSTLIDLPLYADDPEQDGLPVE